VRNEDGFFRYIAPLSLEIWNGVVNFFFSSIWELWNLQLGANILVLPSENCFLCLINVFGIFAWKSVN
jgi:hypothetical protein